MIWLYSVKRPDYFVEQPDMERSDDGDIRFVE